MRKSICVVHGATVGAVVMLVFLVAGSASGAPVLSSTAQVKSAVASAATEARWWGWRGRRGYYRGYGWRLSHVPRVLPSQPLLVTRSTSASFQRH